MMAERDGATDCEVLPEDAAEMAEWPADYARVPLHDTGTEDGHCLQCGGQTGGPWRLCRGCSEVD